MSTGTAIGMDFATQVLVYNAEGKVVSLNAYLAK